MMLTVEQQKKVEENMGLVGKVIKDKVHGANQCGIYTYDDLFQIGCIGLCKAAATDKGGHFSTYAYRLIWNEICDALIYANRRSETELLVNYESLRHDFGDASAFAAWQEEVPVEQQNTHEERLELYDTLEHVKANAVPTVRKGIDALLLMQQGYTAREIGEKMGAAPSLVTAWVSKARKYLRAQPELLNLRANGGGV